MFSDPQTVEREGKNRDLAIQIGAYHFKPFSFQETVDALQSDTALDVMVSVESDPLMEDAKPDPAGNAFHAPLSTPETAQPAQVNPLKKDNDDGGGAMVDLSGYQDLVTPFESTEKASMSAPFIAEHSITEMEYSKMSSTPTYTTVPTFTAHPEMADSPEHSFDYGEYSGNVKTLVQLVNDLPEGVTKQTGAQIIRLTMEAMGISMETVLSDAQSAQSQLLDAVRSNIKKIEEYKTVIRKLETEIRFHQGKANELSEIIDLFILSNTSPNMPQMERSETQGY